MNQVTKSLSQPGAVGIMPTDTVYGLVARALDKESVSKLYSLKGRQNKPGTVIAMSIDQLVDLGLKRRYLSAVKDLWPAALSVVVPCGEELKYLHLGTNGLAVRLPDDEKLIEILKQTGPLLTSSANLPGQPTARNIAEVKEYFPGNIDFYIDGGDIGNSQPSTIVRVIDDAIEVLRQGAFRIN
ncbi:MAG TPA: L-threonylcarbamoyladenylate synthase [Candidatus Saccharimonadales bacterium]